MAEKKSSRFPDPHEFEVPKELEGWEEMYPSHYLFGGEGRKEWEKRQFWYQDKIHAPEPMPPLDLIFQEAWQIALSQNNTRVFCLPPAQGIAHRMVGCYQYICAVPPAPEEVIQEKAELFGKRAPYVFEHYDELWEKWLDKFQALGREMEALEIPEELPRYVPEDQVLPPRGYYASYDVIDAFNRLVSMILKAWQYHFEMLNLTKLAFLMFADVTGKLFPGINESAIAKMVAGAVGAMFRPGEELCRLSKLAASLPGVGTIIKLDVPAGQKIAELQKTEEGSRWLAELEKVKNPWFKVSCGSGWLHYEGSWLDKLDIPFSYMKSYVERLEKGEEIERSLDEISKEREELVAEYGKLIKTDEDKEAFWEAYRALRTIYPYNEDHIFWVEHWCHTIWFSKIREFGQLFVKHGMVKNVDDIFLFNRFEVPQMIEELVTGWALGEGVPLRSSHYMEKAAKRQKILEAARKWNPTPALGVPPDEIAEPFTIMLWGITTEKVQDWLKGVSVKPEEVNDIKGFASSAGVVEGPARLIKALDEIVTLKEGEIMVCPTCNPAWAPVFPKIRATVTDIGGLTSHAAIVCREYRLPAVTGTGLACSVIKTGDIIRVDGDTGVVTILKRAG